jgi:hypothetical protein|tara:strand:- start:495 stop:695 length:201 start_codon:yes stop_codon:yes gene_type:complete
MGRKSYKDIALMLHDNKIEELKGMGWQEEDIIHYRDIFVNDIKNNYDYFLANWKEYLKDFNLLRLK